VRFSLEHFVSNERLLDKIQQYGIGTAERPRRSLFRPPAGRGAAGDQVDFVVASTLNGLRDVLELKRPDQVVLGFDDGHRNYYFSTEVSKAIGQCHRYLDVMHEESQHGLWDHEQVRAYHPRAGDCDRPLARLG
jgi:hypothetical protein